jgi:tetratricopeptide (TPR) repeat protein
VLGHFDEARRSCGRLVQSEGHLIALTCLASVNSLNGRLADSYRSLSLIYHDDPRLPASVRSWTLGQLAEMAARLGDAPAAEKYFRAGLAVTPDDIYLKSDYADLLISQGRNAEVVEMLQNNEAQDNLLLRLAIAGQAVNHRDATRWAQMFEDRYQAARRGGDFTHLREQARFELEVRKQTALALQLAQRNWGVQHEPADVRVYLQAARLANNEAAAKPVLDWIRQVKYEDRTLVQHVASVAAVQPR